MVVGGSGSGSGGDVVLLLEMLKYCYMFDL